MDSRAAVLILLLAPSACSDGGDGLPVEGSLKDRLFEGTETLELKPSVSRITVTAEMGDEDASRTTLAMQEGSTSVRADRDGGLVVEEISLRVDDIVVHHDLLPPEGIHLTNIQARLDGQMDARTEWMSDDELHADT